VAEVIGMKRKTVLTQADRELSANEVFVHDI